MDPIVESEGIVLVDLVLDAEALLSVRVLGNRGVHLYP